ncbi:Crp/Fnr family transcriptional regulator [Nocardia sp. JMUB6875]|uniref:Crp/Fnr family transcriptional regulator n=1 Tax=Nocardia sp. JMUB6875 TaxID=3158170 RepID=UPI0032E5B013
MNTPRGGWLENWPWPERTFMERLSPASRRDLLSLGKQQPFQAGEVLSPYGDPASSVYLLRSRDSKVSACAKITGADGKLLAIRVSGDVIGEIAALEPSSRRSATVTICTAATVHRMPGTEFLRFLDQHPDGWQTLCRTIADRLAWADQRRLDFNDCPVSVRLARLLVEFAESYGRRTTVRPNGNGCEDGEAEAAGWEITIRLNYEELGNLVGAKVDAIGLAMREMREKGLVCLRNRHIVVIDNKGWENYGLQP